MDLIKYIMQSYKTPNKAVLKGLGASDELINYLMETPYNTNFAIAKQLAAQTESTPEPAPEPEPEPTPAMTGIEIIEEPTKTTYSVGDTLDLTGLRVIGHWEGNITDELDYSEYVATPANGTTLIGDITEVVISVGAFEDSFAITVDSNTEAV